MKLHTLTESEMNDWESIGQWWMKPEHYASPQQHQTAQTIISQHAEKFAQATAVTPGFGLDDVPDLD
jgi:hypothetical protein